VSVARWSGMLGLGAIAAQIAYPLTSGAGRDLVTVVVVLALAAASVLHAAATRGTPWTLGLLVVTALGGFGAELLGTATGVPFGTYSYDGTGRLGPELAGVPVLIGLAWTAGAYPAWCAAARVVRTRQRARWVRTVGLAAAGLAGWDLYLDPQLVADGHWTWAVRDAGLPGVAQVPVSNYLGWLLVALVMAALLAAVTVASPRTAATHRSDAVPLALFCWTWLGSALAHAVFLGMPYSAVYGAMVMGVVGVPLLRSLRPVGLMTCRGRGAGVPARVDAPLPRR